MEKLKWGITTILMGVLLYIIIYGSMKLNDDMSMQVSAAQHEIAGSIIQLEMNQILSQPLNQQETPPLHNEAEELPAAADAVTPEPQEILQVDAPMQGIVYEVPEIDTSFKSYTDFRCITDRTSAQWQIREQSYTDENGLRKVGDAYCVALGTYYGTEVGALYWITLDTGFRFKAILADVKMDIHTDPSRRYVETNGNLVEFHIDQKAVSSQVLRMGTVSCIDQFQGKVVHIERIITQNEN